MPALEQHAEQCNRDREIVQHDARHQQLPGSDIVMRPGVTKGHGLDQGVQTQTGHHANRHSSMQMVRVAMLNSHGNQVQSDLCEKAEQDQQADT